MGLVMKFTCMNLLICMADVGEYTCPMDPIENMTIDYKAGPKQLQMESQPL